MRKSQCGLYYVLIMILLMAGMYTAYGNAESFAERAVSMEAVRLYAAEVRGVSEGQQVTIARFERTEKNVSGNIVWVSERVNAAVRTLIGRISDRNERTQRELRLLALFLAAFCIAYFTLKCHYAEEWFHTQEKRYRTALMKYIHDIDGKKRMSCLA